MAVSTLSDMLLGAGLLHGSRILSYEMLVMDTEIWSLMHAMFRGIEVNQETLALDAIRAAGPTGSFLSQRHTRQHMRERWTPALMDRRPYEAWEAQPDGSRQWARQKAQQILKEHHPEPLEPRLQAELRKIIEGVERDA